LLEHDEENCRISTKSEEEEMIPGAIIITANRERFEDVGEATILTLIFSCLCTCCTSEIILDETVSCPSSTRMIFYPSLCCMKVLALNLTRGII
jgi:hypothetical protein